MLLSFQRILCDLLFIKFSFNNAEPNLNVPYNILKVIAHILVFCVIFNNQLSFNPINAVHAGVNSTSAQFRQLATRWLSTLCNLTLVYRLKTGKSSHMIIQSTLQHNLQLMEDTSQIDLWALNVGSLYLIYVVLRYGSTHTMYH